MGNSNQGTPDIKKIFTMTCKDLSIFQIHHFILTWIEDFWLSITKKTSDSSGKKNG